MLVFRRLVYRNARIKVKNPSKMAVNAIIHLKFSPEDLLTINAANGDAIATPVDMAIVKYASICTPEK